MNRAITELLYLGVVLAVVAGLSGCNKGETNSFAALDASLISTPTGGAVQQSGFFVKAVTSTDYPATTYLHKFNDYSTTCEVPYGTSGSDIKCILNVREQDLNFWGLKLEVNVPRSMCKFFRRRPYFYYNFRTGFGPSVISVVFDTTAGGGTGAITSCSYDAGGGTLAGTISGSTCTLGTEGSVFGGGQPTCNYNFSETIGSSYPNCCLGNYIYNYTEITADGTSTSQTKASWGGAYTSCLSGPATQDNWSAKTTSGFPIFAVSDVVDGVNEYFEIKTGKSGNTRGSNAYAANMYGWSNYILGTHSAATIPTAVRPVTDLGGSSMLAGQDSYEFQCLDESAEVLNRIRVYINEWNTNEEFAEYASTSGASTADPNVTGIDGAGCEIGSSVTGNCNDFYDWDDMPTSYPSELRE